jgi:hypothetical protein
MNTQTIVTVSYGRVRGRARRYRYFEPAVYTAHVTRDGRKLWKLADLTHCRARRSYRLAVQDASNAQRKPDPAFTRDGLQWTPVETAQTV